MNSGSRWSTKERSVDKSHIRLSYITHFYINQENISAVISLLEHYQTYPSELLDLIEFIIVDDGSPVEYQVPDLALNMTWLKIDQDIPWNQAGARNLGVMYAKSDRILLTDLDHAFPAETLQHLVERRNPGRNFFKVYRTWPETQTLRKGHSNIFFMSRARFLRFYGYDEEFSGHYGAEDYRFVKFQKYHGSRQHYLPRKYRCIERNIDDKKCYHSLKRDLKFNTPVDKRKKHEIAEYGAEHGHSRLFLNFTWCVLSRQNRVAPAPVSMRWWKPLWWFRYLSSYLSR